MKTITAVVLPNLETQIATGDPLLVDPRGAKLPETLPVFLDFNHDRYIGRAVNLRLDENGNLVADIDLVGPDSDKLPPGVSFAIAGVAKHRTGDVFDRFDLYHLGTTRERRIIRRKTDA